MAEVSRMLPQTQTQITESYFPAIPPKPNRTALSYSIGLSEAPYKALMGILPYDKIPDKLSIAVKYRIRTQTGLSNRWRHPDCLYSDLLGTSQALKSVSMPYNKTLMNIITGRSKVTADAQHEAVLTAVKQERQALQRRLNRKADSALARKPADVAVISNTWDDSSDSDDAESPKLTANRDASKPYSYREVEDRKSSEALNMKPVNSSSEPSLSRSKSMLSAGPLRRFTPSGTNLLKPKDVFLYHSNRKIHVDNPDDMPGDVLLHCLNMDWELHHPYIQKSEALMELLKDATDPTPRQSYRNLECETIDTFINKSDFYSDEYRELSNRFTKEMTIPARETKTKKADEAVCVRVKGKHLTKITLEIDDPLVTQTALAVALGNLYRDETEAEMNDIECVLAAASILHFKPLVDWCVKKMLVSIGTNTVCKYLLAASKYNQQGIVESCERWLELNLIPQLANQIQLRELQMGVLHKTIKSSRLFVYNEYSLYKTLALWIFLQLNPNIQLMPSHSSLLAFFNSLSKTSALVEIDEGQMFLPLFNAVRFHGILDTNHVQDMKVMNILPQRWLVDILSHHYHSLQGGGDMLSVRPVFNTAAIRQGFIINDEPHYHSEVLSIHGFHFELKAIKEPDNKYVFYMQRLDPRDPILTFKQCERHTFSLRRDRDTQYAITVQFHDNGEDRAFTTGVLSKSFGTDDRTSKSKTLQLMDVKKPTYVCFAVLFPPS